MKLRALPHPNGIPKAIGTAQWMVAGRHVHEKASCPIGARMPPMIMTLAVASGGARPVDGSFGCILISFRQSGSPQIPIIVPMPMPTNAKPAMPGPQPRFWAKTMGYATKQRYKIPYRREILRQCS